MYEGMTVKELVAICQRFKLTGYDGFRKQGKAHLIRWMEAQALDLEMPEQSGNRPPTDVRDTLSLTCFNPNPCKEVGLFYLLAYWAYDNDPGQK